MSRPNPPAMQIAYFKAATACCGFPAPTFWAPKADTVESMDEGTKNKKLITFSTIPTAAASVRPLLFAIIVIMINATWIRPSCMAMGKPIFNNLLIVSFLGLKLPFFTVMPVFPLINMVRATITLTVWDKVVPSAAPEGPKCKTPIKI